MSDVYVMKVVDLVTQGFWIIPCRESGDRAKAPYTEHGFKDATNDPQVVRRWWRRWPDALIGAVVPGSLLVLDVDPRNGGSVTALEMALGPLPLTVTVWSGRGDGGCHLYFTRPRGPLSARNLPPGVDLKLNGYCIVPPSLHPNSGQPYRWEGTDFADLPQHAIAALRPATADPGRRTRHAGDRRWLVDDWSASTTLGRNNTLFWKSCRAAEAGLLDEMADDLVDRAVALGLSEREARATVNSARQTIMRASGRR